MVVELTILTFDVEALELMSDFAVKLVEGVRQQNPKLVSFLTESDEPITLAQVANTLEMKINHPDAERVIERIFKESKNNNSTQSERSVHRLAVLLGCTAVVQAMSDSTEEWINL